MTNTIAAELLPPPIIVTCQGADLEKLLQTEWLLTNKIGAYASSTVIGCNARRYHGLLVGATSPPVGRIVALSTVMEQLLVGDAAYDLATNEFIGAFSPYGVQYLVEFRNDLAPTFVYRAGERELVKEIMLAQSGNAVSVRYTLRGTRANLRLQPFTALRDYHQLRRADQPHQMTFEHTSNSVAVQDRLHPTHTLHLVTPEAEFHPEPQWWYQFRYRTEIARGQDALEDLYTPGYFLYELGDGKSCQFTATLGEPILFDFQTATEQRRERLRESVGSLREDADETTRRLAMAGDAFVVRRSPPNAAPSTTILAGYHWFADWGRDAFISLPGLLLSTRRYEQARGVFRTFADKLLDGMIPNRFDDHSFVAHYNSIDASLWFIIAAERYLAATSDTVFWRDCLMPAANAILRAYHSGTHFDIRADADGLLTGGSPKTQLTWMDVALGEEAITPRHGKPVEVNALWYSAHKILAERSRGIDDAISKHYEDLGELIEAAFVRVFWNESTNCLYDCITDDTPDASIRPNQIFAVSLPHSPLSPAQQSAVLRVVTDKLLTPFGLRSLSPDDARYRQRYGGSWESRDRAYHQGTVWGWLMGPFIEAHLKVEGAKPHAIAQGKQWLSAFDDHLSDAGLGYISEIFDGDPPHTPRGCIAQAWSVAELLRVRQLIAQSEKSR